MREHEPTETATTFTSTVSQFSTPLSLRDSLKTYVVPASSGNLATLPNLSAASPLTPVGASQTTTVTRCLAGKRTLQCSTGFLLHSLLPTHSMIAPERYELYAKIGGGTYGTVYSAYDWEKDRDVAIKRLDNRGTQDDRVLNEIKVSTVVSGVEGVATFHGFFRSSNLTCLVFDKIDGVDLFTLMEKRGFLPVDEKAARDILSAVAHTLSGCHTRGIAHRDLKLENIMVDANGCVFLVDFGLASIMRKVEGKERPTKDICGSIKYMAPEYLNRKRVMSTKMDSWALGVTAYILLYGEFPYDEDDLYALSLGLTCVEIPRVTSDGTEISLDIRQKLADLLHVDPEERASVDILM
ncbi:NUAK family SNF1-like kinase 1-like [Planoprotostelium fungivorum]|uniref:NUAK family SNF1-like kinase 1-like n=1 Tax=Planoprotostelium fungivorum TaxID=1890364 RepID=A0A2P6MRU6_9EUKA|nr:NUAK family SNF1-like kinase 1-like [Planoprotostelium fungivorum]